MRYAIMTKRGFVMDPANEGFMMTFTDVSQAIPIMKKGNQLIPISQTAKHDVMQNINAFPEWGGGRRSGNARK